MRTIHQVLWEYKAGATLELISELERRLLELAHDAVDSLGILNAYIEKHSSPEGKNEGFTHILVMEFPDEKTRNLYLLHQRHTKFLEWLGENPIIEKFIAIDHGKPMTPRTLRSATSSAIEKGDHDLMKKCKDDVGQIREIMSKNRNAYSIFAYGQKVGEGPTSQELDDIDERLEKALSPALG